MINSVVLVGRLCANPEMKYSAAGLAITSFRLAVDRGGKKGESGEATADFLSVVCFQKTAELVAQYLEKGSLVGVEGRIQSRTWAGTDGEKKYAVEVVANHVRFLESKAEAARRKAEGGGEGESGVSKRPFPANDPFSDGAVDPFGQE